MSINLTITSPLVLGYNG